jgi:hypothetical protein
MEIAALGRAALLSVIFWSLENLFHFSKKVFRKSPP